MGSMANPSSSFTAPHLFPVLPSITRPPQTLDRSEGVTAKGRSPHLGGWLCRDDMECVRTGAFFLLSAPIEKDLLRAGPSRGAGLLGEDPLGEDSRAGAAASGSLQHS